MALNKEKVMEGARKLAEKNQLDKAIKEYLRVVQEDPKDLRVWLKIGDLHLKRGAKQDATEVYLKVANVYQEQGFLQKAVAVYKQVLKIDPHLVDVNLRLAELFRQLGLLGDAMQHFEAVAGHFHREGNTKEALATVRQLVDLDPENVATRIKLAELYSKENLTVDAIKEFSHATEQLRKLGRQEDFIKVAERLLWHQPTNIELSRELAALYLRRGDARRALQKLQTCFKADGRDVETLAMLAQAFQALEQFSKTVSVLKELAKVHDENKHPAKADEVFRKILEFEPNDADARARFQSRAAAAAAAPGRPATPPAAPPRAATPPPVARAPMAAAPASRAAFAEPPPASSRMTGAVPLIDGNDAAFTMTPTPSLREQLREDGSYREGSVAGERHAEEIARMLVDTDTYIKYGLHQKAIDRLKRLFALDPDNFEGHERLKDVYLAQGREVEALAELTRLADASAPLDPERAIGYVREALAIDASYLPILELARRHRLDVQAPTTLSRDQLSSGAIAIVDDDEGFDDLALDAPPPRAVARPGYRPTSAGDDDDFDPQELIAPRPRQVPHGSPAPGRMPSRGAAPPVDLTTTGEDDDFALEDVAELPAETRQISVDAAMAMAKSTMALPNTDDIDMALGAPGPAPAVGAAGVNWQAPTWTQSSATAPAFNPGLSAQVDAQLDDAALGDEIDHEVAAEFARGAVRGAPIAELPDEPYDDLPFDPAAARAFDAHVAPARAASVPSLGESVDASLDANAELEGEFEAPVAAAFAHEQPTMIAADLTGNPYDLSAAPPAVAPPVVDPSRNSAVLTPPPVLIEDDLDEADFYVTQGMFGQAREILAALLARHPGHRLVTLKLAEVDRAEAGEPLADPDAMGADPALEPTMAATAALTNATQSIDVDFTSASGQAAPARGAAPVGIDETSEAIELDELEELDPELADEVEELADDEAPLAAAPAPAADIVDFGGATVFAADDPGLAAELDGAFPGDDVVDAPSGNVALDDFRGTTGGGRPAVMLEKPVDEGDADTHFDLGQAYKEMGLYDAAIQAFEKAVRAPSRQAQAQLMIGLCHREQGDSVAAASHFKQALHAAALTDLERLSLTYELGVTYEGLGDVGEALYYLEQVVARDPGFVDASTRVAALRGARGGRGVDGPDTSDEHPLR